MRGALAGLLFAMALAAPAAALDPAVEALRQRFGAEESTLLSGLLIDDKAAAAFLNDGKTLSQEDFLAEWRGRLYDFGKAYLAKPHANNKSARTVKELAEPAEWAILVDSLRVHQGEWKVEYFRSEMKKVNEELAAGNYSARAEWVGEKSREKLVESLNEFLASAEARESLARRTRLRETRARAEADRQRAETDRQRAETERLRLERERAAVTPKRPVQQDTPVVEGARPAVVAPKPATGGDEERTALEQAEAAARAAELARRAPTDEDAATRAGTVLDGDRTAVVAPKIPNADTIPPLNRPTITGPRTGPGSDLRTAEPPKPDSDLDGVLGGGDKVKSRVFENKNMIAGGVGAALGAGLGLLAAAIFGGPFLILALVGAALGAAAGFGGMKFFS